MLHAYQHMERMPIQIDLEDVAGTDEITSE